MLRQPNRNLFNLWYKLFYNRFVERKEKDLPKIRGFWQDLIDSKLLKEEKLIILAPMADVTDVAFREMIAKYSKPHGPDVMWTEFVSADGLCSKGREILKKDLEFTEIQRPIVAQLFSSNEKKMREAARLCKELGFDGIDINMGCPDRSIEKQGSGAYHIKDWQTAQKIIKAAQEGAGDLPVSVKTRLGYNKIEFMSWLPKLLECNIPVLTVHLRTRKEMSRVQAHWELMEDIVKLTRDITGEVKNNGTIIIGNGDIISVKEGERVARETKCDGVMIGRGIFGAPWIFNKEEAANEKSVKERLKILIEHTKLFEEKLGNIKNFAIMKKHYKAYVSGFLGAKELRTLLMEANNSKEIEEKINLFLVKNHDIILQ